MPKTGSNIYKRKDGRWEGRYLKDRRIDGKIIYGYVYAKTYSEVKKRLTDILKEEPKQRIATEITVSEVSKQWLSVIRIKVKPSTLATYNAVLDLHVLPKLGRVNMGQVTTALISEFAQEKLQYGRTDGKGGLSVKTVRDILSILKGIIEFAVSEQIINSSISITYPKNQQKKMRVLSPSEQLTLKNYLLENPNIYNIGILLCLFTGLRVGELCGLQWQDFSPELDKLYVRQSVRRIKANNNGNKTMIVVDTPKSKASIREVPIPEFLSSLLMKFAVNDADAYFISTSESFMTEPRTMQNYFKKAIKAANISDANFHSLRHTFSTRCIEANVDIKSLSEMLGHSSVNITLNRYVHSSFEQKQESMNRLEQYLNSLVL